ncbi:alpha-L-fucosidase [Nibricoccus sp. IMCC34717]|uniref:alpha-L-fucosidase n=1 Tax=Nibricoccus sp. IMCC34717 TaxID=3034021 RepID=UPI00384AFE8D
MPLFRFCFLTLFRSVCTLRVALLCALIPLVGGVARGAHDDGSTGTVPAWFRQAKLGIFIHWGIYSEGKGSESWAFHMGQMPYDEYMAQAKTFTAAKYDPEAWAGLFREAGARYAVLTSKHHDGFALWDTALSKLNAREGSPAGRDLIGPYCAALRKQGLKVGLYFSHLDWSHPDYASIMTDGEYDPAQRTNAFSFPQGPDDPARWQRFVAFQRGQIRELASRFMPDLFWFDGDWERSAKQWGMAELRQLIREWQPEAVVNGRMRGHGDYDTPEQALPIQTPQGAWELCMTINDSWGYQAKDRNFKTVREIVRILIECNSLGGNLLLDVGPTNTGEITSEQTAVLKGLGRWTKKHAEVMGDTGPGVSKDLYYGPSFLSSDRKTLYLVSFDRPSDGLWLKGMMALPKRVTVVGGGELKWRTFLRASWLKQPGIVIVTLPEDQVDPDATLVKLEFDEPI